ncbi:hypothetical protein N431DRAFT_561255 [Stipitochalara longipes BDJ]|nr:hypothetical protein N431DRAFT_561255 [Stipitochalara longipes BDJ]
MSGEVGSTPTPERDHSIINTKLRACEACKSRKIRCDKLQPCSACRTAGIQCWTSRQPGEKRQRVLISNKYEEHLESINTHLSQLQGMLANVTKDSLPTIAQRSAPQPVGPFFSPTSKDKSGPTQSEETISSTIPYLGESSFEVHSQQTSQILEKALGSTPRSNPHDDDGSSAWQSIRELLKEKTSHSSKTFTHEVVPMIPIQTALRALRLLGDSPDGILQYLPMADATKLKDICQLVYFPIKGYSMSDLLIVNGGLMSLLCNATEAELKECDIDPAEATRSITICETNISLLIERISPFLEPTVTNIDALLISVQILIGQSKLQKAWVLLSMASRLCLDSGLNRLQDDPEIPETSELREKKTCFWLSYCLDKALSLNFGRTSNFSDFDITITYPSFSKSPITATYIIWMDLGKVQGRIYEKLYSAQGQLQSPESKAEAAGSLAKELLELQRRCQEVFSQLSELNVPHIDTEMTILSNLSLVYRALPTQQPDHPLRFPEECIAAAREALQLHQRLCLLFFARSDYSIRMYIDWNLAFCPFTPFIVILGTAILNTDHEDMNLLSQVVESLERASRQAPGATKLYNICKILLRGAKSCIEQSLGSQPASIGRQSQVPVRNMPEYAQGDIQNAENGQAMFSDGWDPLQLDHLGNMSTLFDNYLAGGASLMPILEGDLTQFDMMDSSSNTY